MTRVEASVRATTQLWVRTVARRAETPAAAAALLALGATGEAVVRADGRVALPLALALALGTTAPVGVNDRTAAAAVVVTASATASLTPFHVLTFCGACGLLICLWRTARWGPRPLAAFLPLPFLAYAVAAPQGTGTPTRLVALFMAAVAAGAAGAGLARRARDDALAHSETERAIADTLLEHAARGERARIARELHDVVAHHISMIAVQAETARLTTPGLPAAGAERFLAIGDTARTALTEMRRLLGVLREDAGGAPVPDRRPQPGLEQLGELIDEARDASAASTRLVVEGPVRPLDPGVELTTYRIVQEALTNARRHAPGAAVDVELLYTRDALRLRVRDNGAGPRTPRPDGGHGLLGMRERAAMAGGVLRTGPARRGGFLVEATFPAPVRDQEGSP